MSTNRVHFFNPITGLFFIEGQGAVADPFKNIPYPGNVGHSCEPHNSAYITSVRHCYPGLIPVVDPSPYRGCIIARQFDLRTGKPSVNTFGRPLYCVFIPKAACRAKSEPGCAYACGPTIQECRAGIDFYVSQGWVACGHVANPVPRGEAIAFALKAIVGSDFDVHCEGESGLINVSPNEDVWEDQGGTYFARQKQFDGKCLRAEAALIERDIHFERHGLCFVCDSSKIDIGSLSQEHTHSGVATK